jgi:hypothetical protein
LNVTVPVAPDVAPDNVELINDAAIATPVDPVAGPDALVAVVACATTVEAMPLPHVLADAPLFESPP